MRASFIHTLLNLQDSSVSLKLGLKPVLTSEALGLRPVLTCEALGLRPVLTSEVQNHPYCSNQSANLHTRCLILNEVKESWL
jgi:hypothetical protein